MSPVDTLLKRAERKRESSRFRESRTLFKQAARQNGPERAQALHGAADCARLLGDFPGALADYGLALKSAPPGDVSLRADLACGQALAWRGAGEPQRALRGLKRAQTAYEGLRDAPGRAFCLWALGGAWRIAGDLPQALKCLKRAEGAYRRLGDA
ncbi:MAG: tetratricopeptide repeat protein, partial [bacterium]